MMKRQIVTGRKTLVTFIAAFIPLTAAFAIHPQGPLLVDNNYVKKHGAVIVGSYVGTVNTPAISVTTQTPVTIIYSDVSGPGDLIYVQNADVTVMDTTGEGTNPNSYGTQKGSFVHAESPLNVNVQHNNVQGVRFAVYVNHYSGNNTPAQAIKVLYNQISNMDARPSDGNGAYFTTGEYNGHGFQLNGVQGVANIELGWNQIINTPYQSQCSDIINIYQSNGLPSSHILIHDNFLKGAFPVNPGPGVKYTGGGIITDGTAADTLTTATAYVDMYNNQVVATANYGLSLASGHDNTANNNRVVSSGYLTNGSFYPTTFGNGLNNYNNYNQPANIIFNNVMNNNYVGLIRSTATGGPTRSDWYLPDQSSSLQNTSWQPGDSAHPTIADENNEFVLWTQKVAQAGLTIGLTGTNLH
jgi:hypothetical protein